MTGRALVVTGAGRGIGAATALRAARDGWGVCVNFRRDERAAYTSGTFVDVTGGAV